MKRSISKLVVLLCMAAPVVALAEDPPPTAADLDKAKKAFAAGKALHEKGKLIEAAEKFKESYKLSKNPVLLYNIGVTFEEAGMEDLALYYFRKFLTDAPQDAGQRPVVSERVKVLEKKFGVGGTTPDTKPDTKPDTTPDTKPDTTKPAVKPTLPCSATDFQHQTVDAAPPSKPLDVTAFVPEDQTCTVVLNYRTAGEGKFTQRPMKWRYKELVARIPPTKMIGSAVQYFIEVKDASGTVITRSGKSTSPNQVLLEAGATPRFYPDVTDDGDAKITPTDIKASDDSDDPLSGKRKPRPNPDDIVIQPVEPGPPGSGFMDAGSTKFTYAKWGATATAGVFVGLGVFSFIQAGKYASALEDDSNGCGAPPCRKFDDTSKGYQDTGKSYQTLYKVGLGVGAGAAVVAGYFWYKELRAKKRGEVKISTTTAPEAASWVVVPTAGDGYAGAAAAVRF